MIERLNHLLSLPFLISNLYKYSKLLKKYSLTYENANQSEFLPYFANLDNVLNDPKKLSNFLENLIEIASLNTKFIPVSVLGKGKSATTYKVYSPELKRFNALKIIYNNFNPKEPELMAKLGNEELDNIVQIYDAGYNLVKSYNYFPKYAILMEYVDGITLRDFINNPQNINTLMKNELNRRIINSYNLDQIIFENIFLEMMV